MTKGQVLTYDAIVFTVDEAREEYAQKHVAIGERDLWRERAEKAEAFAGQVKLAFEEFKQTEESKDLAWDETRKSFERRISTLEKRLAWGEIEKWIYRGALVYLASR